MFVIFDVMCLITAFFLIILSNQELTICMLSQGRKQLVYFDAFYYELSQKFSNAHIIEIKNYSEFSHNCPFKQSTNLAKLMTLLKQVQVLVPQWTSAVTRNVQKAPFSPQQTGFYFSADDQIWSRFKTLVSCFLDRSKKHTLAKFMYSKTGQGSM